MVLRKIPQRFFLTFESLFLEPLSPLPQRMIVVDVKDGEQLERALRRYKKKFERIGIMKEKRRRQHYNPPSDAKREQMKKAKRKQRYLTAHDLG